MARIKGPRKIHRYTAEFKLKAVKLSELKGVQVQDVAEALDIHPFMLSRWRKEARVVFGRVLRWRHRHGSAAGWSSCRRLNASTRCFGRSTSS